MKDKKSKIKLKAVKKLTPTQEVVYLKKQLLDRIDKIGVLKLDLEEEKILTQLKTRALERKGKQIEELSGALESTSIELNNLAGNYETLCSIVGAAGTLIESRPHFNND